MKVLGISGSPRPGGNADTLVGIAFGREKGQVNDDSEGIATVRNLAGNMAWLMKRLAG